MEKIYYRRPIVRALDYLFSINLHGSPHGSINISAMVSTISVYTTILTLICASLSSPVYIYGIIAITYIGILVILAWITFINKDKETNNKPNTRQ